MSATSVALKVPSAIRRRRLPTAALVVAAGTLAVALVGSYIGSNVWASMAQRGLERRFDAATARWAALDPVARSSLAHAPGDPVARLAIPAIGLDVIAVEGSTPAVMRRGPGHLPGSATPGEPGVAIIAGNRFAFGSFFLRIDRLDVGDRITTESAFGATTYIVEEVRVVPADRLDLATDSSRRILVLFGSSGLAGGSNRLVIRAVASGEAP